MRLFSRIKEGVKKLLLFFLLLSSVSAKPVFLVEEQKCAVVFGAAVWQDDKPSHALYDRIKTATDLYNEESVNCLVLSGGASTYGAHEVDVMKKIALEEDVLEEDLLYDYKGVNTESTIRNLPKGVDHFVLVSNDFHIHRIGLMAAKLGIKSFETKAATYNNGRYGREKWFKFREFGGSLYTLLFVW